MKKFTVSKKLYISFASLVILMVILGGISIYQLTSISDRFTEIIDVYNVIGEDAKEINIALLTARRHEKDFIARNDDKYLKRMEDTLKGLRARTEDISNKASGINLDSAVAAVEEILKATQSIERILKRTGKIISESIGEFKEEKKIPRPLTGLGLSPYEEEKRLADTLPKKKGRIKIIELTKIGERISAIMEELVRTFNKAND